MATKLSLCKQFVNGLLQGARPSAAFVQLGEGQLPALVTCVGIFCGILLFRSLPR